MATDVIKIFSSLGLSKTEAKIYMASLRLGPTSVQDIAKRAKLSRTATYDAIKDLQGRSLMSSFERGKKRYFAAEDPESAISHFEDTISHMEQQLGLLQRSLPEIKMMAGGEKPAVRFYEGKEAIFTLFSDIAKVAPKIAYEVTNVDDVYKHMDVKALHEARKVMTGRKIKILYKGEERKPLPSVDRCKLPNGVGDFHGDIWIYEDRVAFVNFIGKVITVIIENRAFADTARAVFDAAWLTCSKK